MSMTENYNPYHSAIIPMIHAAPALLHVVQSMAAFQMHQVAKGVSLRKKAVHLLLREADEHPQRSCSNETVLAITLLGMTESWCRYHCCNASQLLAAGSLVKATNQSSLSPFVINAFRYYECVSAYSLDAPEPPLIPDDTADCSIDPLVGLAADLYPLLSLLGWHIRTQCAAHKTFDIFHLREMQQLERKLVSWKAPPLDAPDARNIAQAYRLSGLISLYRTHHELFPDRDCEKLAMECLETIKAVPSESLCHLMTTLPLFLAGCEISDWESREYVLHRLQWVREHVKLDILSRITDLLYEVWRRQIVTNNKAYWVGIMKDIGWNLVFG